MIITLRPRHTSADFVQTIRDFNEKLTHGSGCEVTKFEDYSCKVLYNLHWENKGSASTKLLELTDGSETVTALRLVSSGTSAVPPARYEEYV